MVFLLKNINYHFYEMKNSLVITYNTLAGIL